MERLLEVHLEKLRRLKTIYQRSLLQHIDWSNRLIGIKGARGVGKTTLLLQRVKQVNLPPEKALFVSLDELWFSEHHLIDLIRQFVQRGGRYLFLDEVHKYPGWSQEIKNAYDTFDELSIVFTGSSMLHLNDSRADLSRRALMYAMQGLSFREYLNVATGSRFESVSLHDLLRSHTELATDIAGKVKPLAHFHEYLKTGYYPFSFENKGSYTERLKQSLLYMLEVDLIQLRNIAPQHLSQLKKLLVVMAQQVPFKPNMVKLAEHIGASRTTLLSYLSYLAEAELLISLYAEGQGNRPMQKPDKVYLHNPNLYHALTKQTNIGTLRETFFLNQVAQHHEVRYADETDFLVDDSLFFEVGGRNKENRQIKSLENAYLAVDETEISSGNRIPLWLFGFLD